MVHGKCEATGLVGLGEDLPELRLECFSRWPVETHRCDVPAQEMPAVSDIVSESAFAHECSAGVMERKHVQEVWL